MCEDYYGDLGCCLTCTEYDKMYEVEGYSEDPYDGSCLLLFLQMHKMYLVCPVV